MGFLEDLLKNLTGQGGQQQAPRPVARPQAPAPTRDNMITNQMVNRGQLPQTSREIYPQGGAPEIKYPRSNPETGFYDAGPAPEIKYPRFNPESGFRDPGPAPFRAQGLPVNFHKAPQLPVHDDELYDEVLRVGGFNDFRR